MLVHDKHARAFNRLLGEAGATHLRLIQVSELDPARMLELAQATRAANGFPSLATAFRCLVNAPCTRISWALPRHFHKALAAGRATRMSGESAQLHARAADAIASSFPD